VAGKAAARSGRHRKLAGALKESPAARIFDIGLYGGKVVATRQGEVVAVGESFSEVDAEIRKRGLQNEVILTRVPEREDFVL
jgi:hypothetical protein